MRKRSVLVRAFATIVAVVLATLALNTATATAVVPGAAVLNEADAPAEFKFENVNSHKCITIPGSSTAVGVQATQFTCNPLTLTKRFHMLDWGPDEFGNPIIGLRNANSYKCLGVPGSSTAEGTAVGQYTCSGNEDQKWSWDTADRLRNRATNQCLSVPYGWTSDSVGLIQWGCGTSNAQRWDVFVIV